MARYGPVRTHDHHLHPRRGSGVLQSRITLTEGSTAQQTPGPREIEDYMLKSRGRDRRIGLRRAGLSFGGSAQNRAMIFVKLRDFDLRRGGCLGRGHCRARQCAF